MPGAKNAAVVRAFLDDPDCFSFSGARATNSSWPFAALFFFGSGLPAFSPVRSKATEVDVEASGPAQGAAPSEARTSMVDWPRLIWDPSDLALPVPFISLPSCLPFAFAFPALAVSKIEKTFLDGSDDPAPSRFSVAIASADGVVDTRPVVGVALPGRARDGEPKQDGGSERSTSWTRPDAQGALNGVISSSSLVPNRTFVVRLVHPQRLTSQRRATQRC